MVTKMETAVIYLREGQIVLAEAINYASFLRNEPPAGISNPQRFQQDIDRLMKILGEGQVILADLIILRTGPAELQAKISADHLAKIGTNLDKILTFLESYLPKREVPLIAKGNMLALLCFRAANQLELSLASGLAADLQLAPLLSKLSRLFFDFGRWSNWLLDKREYLWRPPGEMSGGKNTAAVDKLGENSSSAIAAGAGNSNRETLPEEKINGQPGTNLYQPKKQF